MNRIDTAFRAMRELQRWTESVLTSKSLGPLVDGEDARGEQGPDHHGGGKLLGGKSRGGVLKKRYVETVLIRVTGGRLQAGVRNQSSHDDLGHAVRSELVLEVGVCEAADAKASNTDLSRTTNTYELFQCLLITTSPASRSGSSPG